MIPTLALPKSGDTGRSSLLPLSLEHKLPGSFLQWLLYHFAMMKSNKDIDNLPFPDALLHLGHRRFPYFSEKQRSQRQQHKN